MTDTTQSYDYTAEKDDKRDKIGFGKHKNWTPAELLMHEPKYIVWAWNKTQFWVGSEDLVRRAHKITGDTFKPRAEPTEAAETFRPVNAAELVDDFEATCIETFGCFPYKSWQT